MTMPAGMHAPTVIAWQMLVQKYWKVDGSFATHPPDFTLDNSVSGVSAN
jgi:hypothetical protein